MINIAVFASGNGSNFEAIVANNIGVKLLVCNNNQAYAIQRAIKHNIPYLIVNSNIQYEQELVEKLKALEIDLIVLAGYMKLLTNVLVDEFKHRIINIHPSLLPNYKGKDAIQRAYEAGEDVVGVTIHYVDITMDGGEIIAAQEIIINEMTIDELETAVHRVEHQLYPRVIKNLIKEWSNEKSIDISK